MATPSQITITATMYPRADRLDELLRVLRELSQAVRETEPDVLAYYAIQTKDSEGTDEIMFIEQYKNQAALDAHVKTRHYQRAAAQFPALFSKPPSGRFGSVVGGFTGRGVSLKFLGR